MVAAFIVLSSPKGLKLAGNDHLERSEAQAKELEAELQDMLAPLIGDTPLREMGGVTVQAREGGILAAFGDESEVCSAALDDRIAVFQGQLRNLPQLIQKCMALSKPSSPTSTHNHSCNSSVNGSPMSPGAPAPASATEASSSGVPSAELPPLNAASVILLLYGAYGSPMLAQLTGRFSFCMYDAKQVRVLAARDGSGAIPLLQARTPRNSMALSSNPALLKACHDSVQFEPGMFKYGWQSAPRLFTAADAAPPHAAAAVRRSIEQRKSVDHTHTPGSTRRVSGEHGPHTPPLGGRRSVDAHHHGNGGHHAPGTPPHIGRSSARASLETGQGRPSGGRRASSDAHPVHSPSRYSGGSRGARDGEQHSSPPSKLQPRASAPVSEGAISRPAGVCGSNGAASATAAEGLHSHLAHLNVNAKVFVPTTELAPSS